MASPRQADAGGLDREIAEQRSAKYDAGREQQARDWLEQISGLKVEGDFVEALKNGVVLCTTMNVIQAGLIPSFAANPKHYLEDHANLEKFFVACRAIGVPSSDMSTKLDFSDAKRDVIQITQNIFAVGRQAQAIGFEGPILGKKFAVTREQQIALEREKEEERRQEEIRLEAYENERRARREFLEDDKAKRHSALMDKRKSNRMSRRDSRRNLGREHLKENEFVYADKHEDERPPSPVRYGLDLDLELRKKEEDMEEENNLMDWIEDVTGVQVDSMFLSLRSGVLLCDFMNKLIPGSIPKIAKPKTRWRASALPERENIGSFLEACKTLGIPQASLFHINDLYERKDMVSVRKCLIALATFTSIQPNFSGPKFAQNAVHRPRPIDLDAEIREVETREKTVKETRISAPMPQRPKPRVDSVAPVAETSEEDDDPNKKPSNKRPHPTTKITPNPNTKTHLKEPLNIRRRASPNKAGSIADNENPSIAPIPMGFRQSQRAQPKNPGSTPLSSPIQDNKSKSSNNNNLGPKGLQGTEGNNPDEAVVTLENQEDSPFLSGDDGAFVSFPRKLLGLGIVVGIVLLMVATGVLQHWLLGAAKARAVGPFSGFEKPALSSYVTSASTILALPIWIGLYFAQRKEGVSPTLMSYLSLKLGWQTLVLALVQFASTYTWILSQQLMPNLSPLTNTFPILVLAATYFPLKEPSSPLKITASIVSLAGTLITVLFSIEKIGTVAALGCVFISFSILLRAVQQTLFALFNRDSKSRPLNHAVLVLGLQGLISLVAFWPAVLIVNYTGFEKFELPSILLAECLTIESLASTVQLLGDYVGTLLSGPLFISIGWVLVYPASVLFDLFMAASKISALLWVGVFLSVAAFVAAIAEKIMVLRKSGNEDGKITPPNDAIDNVI